MGGAIFIIYFSRKTLFARACHGRATRHAVSRFRMPSFEDGKRFSTAERHFHAFAMAILGGRAGARVAAT